MRTQQYTEAISAKFGEGDTLKLSVGAMGQAVESEIGVDETVVHCRIVLPGLLGMMAGPIEAMLRNKGSDLLLDDKRDSRFTLRQGLIALLLVYCGLTTLTADYPESAVEKWAWVWKALVFAIFLPLTLTTRLRMESAALTMVWLMKRKGA